MSARSIHVFASDVPWSGCPTLGARRSGQVISALRNAGYRLTFSFALPAGGYGSLPNDLRAGLSDLELWCCEHHLSPEIVLNRVQPDLAVYCDVNTLRTVRRFAKDIVHVLDLYRPVQFEALMSDSDEVAVGGDRLQRECARLVERLNDVDYIVTVSERQRYFWLAYCSLSGFSFSELTALICPFCVETNPRQRKLTESLSLVHAEGFYPLQNQERFLRAAASLVDEIPGAKLHIAGGSVTGMPYDRQAEDLIGDLQRHQSVQYHGSLSTEHLGTLLESAWAALDLKEQTIESELATGEQTVEYLASGVPVIYNQFGTLAKDIRDYGAGWTIETDSTGGLESVLKELANSGHSRAEELSRNALRLSSEKLDPIEAMRPLVTLCDSARKRSGLLRSHKPRVNGKPATIGRVLALSRDTGAIGELRMNNPLRALHRQRLIDGFVTSDPSSPRLAGDDSCYEVIFTQRAIPDGVWLALAQLGLPYLLDVDDNLLARAEYRRKDPEQSQPWLFTGLRHASVLTVPNPRLVQLLEKYSTLPLTKRSYIAPNALPYGPSRSSAEPVQPAQILWIQSDIAALTDSREAVIRAVETVSSRYKLPVVLIGKNVLEQPKFTRQVVMGEIDFNSNLQLLATAPTSIGVAPLETDGDPETIDFICGKSDLKILLFSGYGHPGVFSASPPYTDSPLRNFVTLTNNTYEEWVEALEYTYREGWKSATTGAERVQEERNIDRVAREAWAPAIEACVLPRPIRGADLYEAITAYDTTNGASLLALESPAADSNGHTLSSTEPQWTPDLNGDRSGNQGLFHEARTQYRLLDRLEQEIEDLSGRRLEQKRRQLQDKASLSFLQHEVRRLRNEVNDLLTSYSWKVTAPLRVLAKPVMERLARRK